MPALDYSREIEERGPPDFRREAKGSFLSYLKALGLSDKSIAAVTKETKASGAMLEGRIEDLFSKMAEFIGDEDLPPHQKNN